MLSSAQIHGVIWGSVGVAVGSESPTVSAEWINQQSSSAGLRLSAVTLLLCKVMTLLLVMALLPKSASTFSSTRGRNASGSDVDMGILLTVLLHSRSVWEYGGAITKYTAIVGPYGYRVSNFNGCKPRQVICTSTLAADDYPLVFNSVLNS